MYYKLFDNTKEQNVVMICYLYDYITLPTPCKIKLYKLFNY